MAREPRSYVDSLVASLPAPVQRLIGETRSEYLIAGGAALFSCVCLFCICSVLGLLLLQPPALPPTPRPNPTLASSPIPVATLTPTANSANFGQYINPYISANLAGMTILQIDVRDPATGSYVRKAQLTDTGLTPFITALNVSVQMTAPAPDCVDHVRLTVTRADNSVVTFGVCLKGSVILRGIPDLAGADAPMYAGFTDALLPYLPDEYKKLLQ
ncbi:MAG TPA: hypothetical protein VMT34_13810 [Aggregatilineales bacterium]|nr:hypothetical protein [Aggregatilineales bacterium]